MRVFFAREKPRILDANNASLEINHLLYVEMGEAMLMSPAIAMSTARPAISPGLAATIIIPAALIAPVDSNDLAQLFISEFERSFCAKELRCYYFTGS